MPSAHSRAGSLELRPALLWVLTFFAASLAMRLLQARESLWLDELHTAWVISADWDEIAARAKAGNQPPLFLYLERFAIALFGMSEPALRLPSILAGAALAPLSFVLVRRWTDSTAAGVAAAVVAAIDRDFLFYATEARVYALVQLLALVRLGAFVRLLSAPTMRLRLAYVGLAALMFHLHYTTALVWFGEALCVAVLALRRFLPHHGGRGFICDSLLMLLLFLPAAPHVGVVFERRENWAGFVPVPTFAQLATERFAQRIAPAASYLTAALVTTILAIWFTRRSQQIHKDRVADLARILTVTALWIAAPVALAWLLSLTDVARVFLYRYLIASASAAPLLAGLICGLSPSPAWRRAAAAAAIFAAVSATGPEYLNQLSTHNRFLSDRSEDWRSAVAYINAHDDYLPVLLYAGLIETHDYASSPDPLLRAYCVLPVTGIYRFDDPRTVIPLPSLHATNLTSVACQAIRSHRSAWMLLRIPEQNSPTAIRRAASLAASCDRQISLVDSQTFGGVTAIRIEFADPIAP
jgi:uncharacterized membrane protein